MRPGLTHSTRRSTQLEKRRTRGSRFSEQVTKTHMFVDQGVGGHSGVEVGVPVSGRCAFKAVCLQKIFLAHTSYKTLFCNVSSVCVIFSLFFSSSRFRLLSPSPPSLPLFLPDEHTRTASSSTGLCRRSSTDWSKFYCGSSNWMLSRQRRRSLRI